MSAQDFRRKIVKLQRSSEILKTEIAEVHPFLKYHIEDSFLFNEPENSFDLQVGEFEGLSYGEFRLDQLTERLDEFLVILEDANEHFNPPRHRPKELEHLENSIKRLGIVFEKISGDEPLSTYTMAEVGRGGKEYSGPFFDFACHVLWGFAGKEFPQRSALAETARRVFGKK